MIANGAAARLVQRGDQIIIITYVQLADSELPGYQRISSTWTTRTATCFCRFCAGKKREACRIRDPGDAPTETPSGCCYVVGN